MVTTGTFADVEFLIACVFTGGDARDLRTALSKAAGVLAGSDVPYALAGNLGRARFCRARWTDIIDVRVAKCGDENGLERALRSAIASSVSATSTVRLDLTFARFSKERAFIQLAPAVECLGTPARMATVEHLLWLSLSSDGFFASQAIADAVHLIQSGNIDWDTFDAVVGSLDPAIQRRLSFASRKAQQTANSSYSESVTRRTAANPIPFRSSIWRARSD